MNRLQKKCLFASAGMHTLLALILLVGPAFLSRKPPPFNLPALSVIPSRTVDALLSGGGNPNASPPPPALAPAPIAPPQPQPLAIEPPRIVQPLPQPKPVVVKPAPAVKAPPEPEKRPEKIGKDPALVPASNKIKVNPALIKRSSVDTPAVKPAKPAPTQSAVPRDTIDREAQRRIASGLLSSIRSSVQTLNDSLSSGTTIDIPGPGGEAFANYGQVVIAIYKQNWIQPVGIKGYHVVKTTVVIGRDGRVRSHAIVTRCGNPAVDRSVADVLERVTFVAPFPKEARDENRSFTINFELNPEADTG